MQWGNPTALWTLLIVPLAALVAWWAARRRRGAVQKLGTAELVDRLYAESVRRWRLRKTLAALAALLLLCLGAARPQYGRVEQTVRRAGIDIILAVDVSASMLAGDLEPHRLARAREALARLLGRLRGNRIGIIAFAGDAFLLCPMTQDSAIAKMVLESIDERTVGVQGTDLGRVIEVAQGAFKRGGDGSHVLVLITDGEDNEARGLAAATEAAETLRIYAVGIGTERGAPVPEGRQGYKESAGGGKVVSRLDMQTLSAIARETGGTAYAVGDNPAAAVGIVADEIDQLEKIMQESRKFVIYQDRYGWFVVPAMALMLWLLLSRPQQATQPRPALDLTPAAAGRRER